MYNQTIAKLLAKEDITIQHGNYQTAWFDIQNRTLGLPMWKDMGKDVYDLLIGHEVGHALYTPFEGWHDSPDKLEGAPRSYINVVEDARIERFIQKDYPGLVGPFRRGYQNLVDRGSFFKGIEDADWNKTKLIDKINTKAKLGNMVNVPFNDEEIIFYKRSMTTKTFDEVVQLCKDILEYTRENQPELLKQPEPEPELDIPEGLEEMDTYGSPEDPSPMGHDDMDPPENNSDSADSDDDSASEDLTEEGEQARDEDQDSADDDSNKTGKTDKGGEDDEALTDIGNRDAERDLVETDRSGRQPQFMAEPSKAIRDKVIVKYNELAKARKNKLEGYQSYRVDENTLEAIAYYKTSFNPYIKGVKKSANYAVKEFEMRKAAFQWQRAQTAKSGSLDVNKVHSYKFNEDIFARVTQLANAKNHGMIMFIDYSGSMSGTLSQVLDQLLHLVVFCKSVNIPFDVYAFTTNNHIPNEMFRDGEVQMNDTHLTQLISSDLKKKQYEEALFGLYLRMKANDSRNNYYYSHEDLDSTKEPYIDEYDITPPCEAYGSTPLNQGLILAHRMVREFRAKHNVDKMNLVILSDGDSNYINQHKDYNIGKDKRVWNDFTNTNLLVDKKLLRLGQGRIVTHQLLENISKRYGCQTLGFFISDHSRDWSSKLWECKVGYEDRAKVNKEYRKYKCVTMNNVLGYDEFYLIKGGSQLDTQEEEFEVDSDASTARIRSAFKKFATSKKNNKTLLTNFGKVVA